MSPFLEERVTVTAATASDWLRNNTVDSVVEERNTDAARSTRQSGSAKLPEPFVALGTFIISCVRQADLRTWEACR